MRLLFTLFIFLAGFASYAQPHCDSLFTLHRDKPGSSKYTWVMHTPIRLSNYSGDTTTIELRLQKMRSYTKWIIIVTAMDKENKCVRQGDKIYFKFHDDNEPGYRNEAAGNCEGLYQVDIPLLSVGTTVGSNKLKSMLRSKRLVSVSLEHVKGFTDGTLTEEQGEILRDMINCMLEE